MHPIMAWIVAAGKVIAIILGSAALVTAILAVVQYARATTGNRVKATPVERMWTELNQLADRYKKDALEWSDENDELHRLVAELRTKITALEDSQVATARDLAARINDRETLQIQLAACEIDRRHLRDALTEHGIAYP